MEGRDQEVDDGLCLLLPLHTPGGCFFLAQHPGATWPQPVDRPWNVTASAGGYLVALSGLGTYQLPTGGLRLPAALHTPAQPASGLESHGCCVWSVDTQPFLLRTGAP